MLNPFAKKNKEEKKLQQTADVDNVQTEAVAVATPLASYHSGVSVLKNIYTSEKATRLTALNQYVFEVKKEATKNEIKKEVGVRYNVKVKDVKMINIKGKEKTLGRYSGMRAGRRKAVVVLYPGSVIAQAKP